MLPMKATVTWERVQLGNLTRLIYGEDRGWRGALEASAQFTGTPAALHFTTAAKLRDFRRFDISSGDAANLNATCAGELNVSTSLLQSTECRLPLDGGLLSVQGTLRGLHSPRYDLTLSAENLGANACSTWRGAPSATCRTTSPPMARSRRRSTAAVSDDAPSLWIGNLAVNSLVLHSSVLGKDLAINRLALAINTVEPLAHADLRHRRGSAQQGFAQQGSAQQGSAQPLRALVIQSFQLPLGGAAPAAGDGMIDGSRFALHLAGDATLQRLQQCSRALGIGAPRLSLTGPATIDLTVGGGWGEAPQITGSAQLRNASLNAQPPP